MIEKTEKNIKKTPPRALPWIISGTFFMQMLDGTILNTSLPKIAESINESPLEIQSIIIAYFLTVAFLLPLSGYLADRFGSKKAFGLAIILFTTGSLFCSMAQNLTQLVLSRIFQATGGALMVPVGRLIVLKTYPKKQLLDMLSFIMIPALIGPLIGPALGGFIVEYFTWQWIFLINIPIGIICFIMVIKIVPDVKEENYSFDWIGFFMFSTSIILFSASINTGKVIELLLSEKIAMVLLSLALFTGYWIYAKHVSQPLYSPKLLKIRSFVVGAIGSSFSRIGGGSLVYLSPLMLQVGLGFAPSKAGLMVLTMGVSSIIAKPLVSKVIGFFGYRKFLFLNTLSLGILIASFSLVTRSTPEYIIIIMLYILGTINSMQFTSMATLSLIDLPRKYASEGNSFASVTVQIAVSMGVGIAALILSTITDLNGPNTDILNSFHTTFLIIGSYTMLTSINFLFTPQKVGEEDDMVTVNEM